MAEMQRQNDAAKAQSPSSSQTAAPITPAPAQDAISTETPVTIPPKARSTEPEPQVTQPGSQTQDLLKVPGTNQSEAAKTETPETSDISESSSNDAADNKTDDQTQDTDNKSDDQPSATRTQSQKQLQEEKKKHRLKRWLPYLLVFVVFLIAGILIVLALFKSGSTATETSQALAPLLSNRWL
jgi:thiol:disulfide interchange protein